MAETDQDARTDHDARTDTAGRSGGHAGQGDEEPANGRSESDAADADAGPDSSGSDSTTDDTDSGDRSRGRSPDSAGVDPPAEPENVDWSGFSERVSSIAGVLAPTTALAAVLYYFGYVATYSRFAYFGIDLAMLELSMEDVILRSAAVMFVPLAALLGAGIAFSLVARLTRGVLRSDRSRESSARRTLLRATALLVILFGLAMLARGLAGILNPAIAQTEFPGLTPFSLGVGVLATSYGAHIFSGTRAYPVAGSRLIRVMSGGLVLLSLFWMANTFAGAYGRGQAVADLEALRSRPAVIVDTKESLHAPAGCLTEQVFASAADQEYKYRYSALRLLTKGGDRLFLISDQWALRCAIVVVPDDESIRIQLGP